MKVMIRVRGLVTFALAILFCMMAAAAGKPRPNILFIAVDDLRPSIDYIRAKAKLDEVEIKPLPKARGGLDLSGLLGDDEDEIFQGELSRQLAKLYALGFDTKPLEFLLRNARPKAMQMWMLQPMNFQIR